MLDRPRPSRGHDMTPQWPTSATSQVRRKYHLYGNRAVRSPPQSVPRATSLLFPSFRSLQIDSTPPFWRIRMLAAANLWRCFKLWHSQSPGSKKASRSSALTLTTDLTIWRRNFCRYPQQSDLQLPLFRTTGRSRVTTYRPCNYRIPFKMFGTVNFYSGSRQCRHDWVTDFGDKEF